MLPLGLSDRPVAGILGRVPGTELRPRVGRSGICTMSTSRNRPHVAIFTDGACDPNPGPGGYGVVLVHPKKRAELSGGFRRTTNNRMEILAAINGLEKLKRPCRVTLCSDSQYLVKAMTEGWVKAWRKRGWWRSNKARPENLDLWQRLVALCDTHHVGFCWIRGHHGHRENERCDELATTALRQPNLPADLGYEHKPRPDDRA